MTAWQFLLLVLCTYRLARLVAIDTVWEGTRTRLLHWLASRDGLLYDKAGELLGCPYCVGVWVGTAAWAWVQLGPTWRWQPVRLTALWGAAAFLASLERATD